MLQCNTHSNWSQLNSVNGYFIPGIQIFWICNPLQGGSRASRRRGRQPYFYRPQTRFAKIMFSQVFVHSWGILVSILEGGGSLSREVFVQGSLSRGCLSRGLCLEGLCPGGSLSGGFLSRGCLSRGVSVKGDSPPYGKERMVCILLECILV